MKRPFAHIGFSCAVTLLAIQVLGADMAKAAAAGLAVLLAVSLAVRQYREAAAAPLVFGAALFSCLLFLTVYSSVYLPVRELDGKSCDAVFYITDLPYISGERYVYTVKTQFIDCDGAPQTLRLKLFADMRLAAEPYRLLRGNLRFQAIPQAAFGTYSNQANGIFANAYINTVSVTEEIVRSPLRWLVVLREQMMNQVFYALGGDDAGALAVAMMTGDRHRLSDEAYYRFLFSGVSHIMAISGLHLSVIAACVAAVLKRVHAGRKVTALAVIGVVLLFMGLVGFRKSVVRAGVMVIVISSAALFNRRGDTLNSLGAAVFFICLNPFAVGDAGAVLSVLSVLSLSTLYPAVRIRKARFRGALRQTKHLLFAPLYYLSDRMLATLCILLFTMPAAYVFFGSFTAVALAANLVIIPLASLSTVMSFVTYAFHFRSAAPDAVSVLHRLLNELILRIVGVFSSAYGTSFEMGSGFAVVFAVILLCFAVSFTASSKRLLKGSAALCCVLLTVSCVGALVLSYHTASVYVCQGGSVIISDRGHTVAAGFEDEQDYYEARAYLINTHRRPELLIYGGADGNAAVKLSDAFQCKKIVLREYNDTVATYARAQTVTAARYSNELSDSLKITCFYDKQFDYITVLVYNTQITAGHHIRPAGDITVTNGGIIDRNGSISLKEGGVSYRIGRHFYYARRVGDG